MAPARKKSTAVVTLGKSILAAAIVLWLYTSGKLEFSWIRPAIHRWPILLSILALVLVQMALMAWRWNILLVAQRAAIGIRTSMRLTFIGSLFNTVIPGAIGGDLAKAYYVSKHTGGRQLNVMVTILVDRVVGLLGLFSVGILASAWQLGTQRLNAYSWRLCIAVLTVGIVCLILSFLAVWWGEVFAQVLCHDERASWRIWTQLGKVADALGQYRGHGRVLLRTLTLSFLIQILACAGIYLAALSIGSNGMSPGTVLIVAPLVLFTLAVPLTPLGLGVGQAAFYTLLEETGLARGIDGANCLMVHQVLVFLAYLSGLYFYLVEKPTPCMPSGSVIGSSNL